MQSITINLTVNGKSYEKSVEPRRLASDFLREDLGLTGTPVGCEHGICGCCNILLDDKTARSCLLLAVQLDGANVRTVESLGTIDNMHSLQEAFWATHGLQCGFCTPGMLMSATELLENNASPDRVEIRAAISNNLCRCTGYETIVDAVESAVSEIQEGAK